MNKNRIKRLSLLLSATVFLTSLSGCKKLSSPGYIKYNGIICEDYLEKDGKYYIKNEDGDYILISGENIEFVSTKHNKVKYNAYVNFYGKTFKLQLFDYDRSEEWTWLTLLDGSCIRTNTSNVVLLPADDDSFDSDAIEVEYVLDVEKKDIKDTALIIINGEVYKCNIKKYDVYSSWILITLEDDSIIRIDTSNVIIYNKESKIVEQIEDSFSPKLVK